ncbi:hypothetical protein [Dokdonella soli]|uniref:hypothetical protein n=1 Tax=Dokdonella soli TaxID=529810 RepID=UPI0031D171C1
MIFTAYRQRGPTQEQRDALALMQKDYRPTRGVNAFPLLWFMRYDVPEEQLAARMAADVEAVRYKLAAGEIVGNHEPDAPPLAEPPIDATALCEIRAPGCLAKVVTHPEGVRTILASHPALMARAQAFDHTDFYWNEFLPRVVQIAHPGVAQQLWLSAFALQYVDGDHAGALTSTCRNLGAWRRMQQGTNSLIGAMIAASHGDGAIHLLADMLAGLRAGEAVPAECVSAAQPIAAADVDRCAQMAGEFRAQTSILRDVAAQSAQRPWWERAINWLSFEERQTKAWIAENFASYCGEAAVAHMLADQSSRSAPSRPLMHRPECVSSLIGCILSDIAAPAYADYDQRTLDFAAHLRLAATLLWLHDNPGGTLSERFERRPASLRSARHASGVDVTRGLLYVDNFHAQREARFELPVSSVSADGTLAAQRLAQPHP